MWISYVLLFFLGAAVGSFLNVLISRSIEGKDWQRGRSKCDHCGKVLSWYDMIPVVSYIVYRGRSKCCGKRLSMQHPVVEIMVGTLFVWWLAVGTLFFQLVSQPLSLIQPLYWLIIGIILLTIFIADWSYGLIPTVFVSLGVVMTILYRLILIWLGPYQVIDLGLSLVSALGAAMFFASLRWVTRGRGMGDGDVILAFLLGLILSWPKVIPGILAGFVLGAGVSLLLIALRLKTLKSTIPFGPFMISGFVVTLLYGSKLLALLGFY